MRIIVKLVLLIALALVAAFMLLVAAHVTAMPAAAKVEPARPEMRGGVEIEAPPPRRSEVPCLEVRAPERERRVVWVIRAADGTVISAGAVDVRQRC